MNIWYNSNSNDNNNKHTSMYVYIYIYICRERERERYYDPRTPEAAPLMRSRTPRCMAPDAEIPKP